MCFACRTIRRDLTLGLAPVLPVSLCPLPGPLYSVLMGYKESPVEEVRRRGSALVAALFRHFLIRHRRCVEHELSGPADLVLPVPSSARPGRAPLDRVLGSNGCLALALGHGSGPHPPLWCPSALARTAEPVGHMRAHPGAFAVPDWAAPLVAQARVLLLDDTYVSGARSQSAVGALRLAGAARVLIVPLGRVIRPDKVAEHAAFLQRSRAGHRADRAQEPPCGRCVLAQAGAGAWTE
jgi:hypothetical protein